MVPDGWKGGKAHDLIDSLDAGISVNGEDRFRKEGEKAVLKVSAVTYGVFDPLACKVIVPNELTKAKITPKSDQIIISRSNTQKLVGASAYIKENYDYLFLSDKLWQIIPKPNVNMMWLSYILASRKTRYILSNLATGTSDSMKNITKNELLGLKILIPSLPEQQKIAQILSTWDKAIEKLKALISIKKKRKKALMQQLLTGKKRFSGFEGKGEWKLTAISEIINESRIPSILNNPKKRLTIRLNFNGIKRREFRGTESLGATAHFIRKSGQFIYGKQNFHKGAFGIIPTKFNFYETSQDIPSFDFLKGCNSTWFYYYCSQSYFYTGIENLMTGTGSKRLNPKVFQKIKLLLPPIKEQKKIATVLSTVDKEIETHQKQLDAFKQQKKGLMQQLLTGKKRVKLDNGALDV